MIEFIKSKQDEIITKKEIRRRRLDQSMLRFTRIYRDEHGEFRRDVESEEYSCIMTERKTFFCLSLEKENYFLL
jgi:hypothetical protein